MSVRPFVLAHVSDLHVSTFGDTFHDRLRVVARSKNLADADSSRWEAVWRGAGWQVLRKVGKKSKDIQLLDPSGYAHRVPSRKQVDDPDPVVRAAWLASRLDARRSAVLAESPPSAARLALLAEGTPKNTNVRLLQAASAIGDDVDAVAITGDLTDDGAGYEVVLAAFARFRARGRLYAVPGNHDLYMFPFSGSGRPRPTPASKREGWRAFASALGLDLHPSGAYVRHVPEASCVIVGLDSCARPQRRFFRHNGAIGAEQSAYLRAASETPEYRAARHRLVLLHHHVVPLPHGVGRRAPSEIGMRLDDAESAARLFDEVGVTAVLHGHRHVSEERKPAGARFRIFAAPSFTLGCRSGDGPSYWRIELGERVHGERVYTGGLAVAGDSVVSLEATDEPGDDEAT